MSTKDNTTPLLLTEIEELLDAMILELELRGCQAHHELVKRALKMQNRINKLREDE